MRSLTMGPLAWSSEKLVELIRRRLVRLFVERVGAHDRQLVCLKGFGRRCLTTFSARPLELRRPILVSFQLRVPDFHDERRADAQISALCRGQAKSAAVARQKLKGFGVGLDSLAAWLADGVLRTLGPLVALNGLRMALFKFEV